MTPVLLTTLTTQVIADFVAAVAAEYDSGQTTEHSFRPALKALLQSLGENIVVINEPKRIAVGSPDLVVQEKNNHLPLGYLEAKDIGVDLNALSGSNAEQLRRYCEALPNLIYSNCLDWVFYVEGQKQASVSIAHIEKGKVVGDADRYAELLNLLQAFVVRRPQTVITPQELAERMAGKARLLRDALHRVLVQDQNQDCDGSSNLTAQYLGFQQMLIHDISHSDFADIYAETLTYGMFAARLHDQPDGVPFSRAKAATLLPKTNPFLRSLFHYIANDLEDDMVWVVDDLVQIFAASDMAKVMQGFGSLTGKEDPFLHFYETFLAAYNPDKRKARGVWYTPEPVVDFIVRAVDELLQHEFVLPQGLADTSKVSIEWQTGELNSQGEMTTETRQVHRVQILDPATGTGTFLAATVKHIANKAKAVGSGAWQGYVEKELLPRLHGFELLMSSYAMCHVKLDRVLAELGYRPSGTPPRLSVYLTDSLERFKTEIQELFMARWLSDEAKGANHIKRNQPIMCVLGNPPYSGISQNMSADAAALTNKYLFEPGGVDRLQERKHWLHDDYVKFISLAENYINKSGEGVLGLITNHGYLDNPTFRGMRWHLMQSFDAIYVLDLHGNAKKKETAPDGSADSNVFDIQQGVAIIIAVKKKHQGQDKKPLARVFRGDLWGEREHKYAELKRGSLRSLIPQQLQPQAPSYLFRAENRHLWDEYQKGFALDELMPVSVTGIVTARDSLVIDWNAPALKKKMERFLDPQKSDEQIRGAFFGGKSTAKYPAGDSRGWKLGEARQKLRAEQWSQDIQTIAYRPFDERAILYRPDMVDWGRQRVMHHMTAGKNVSLNIVRQVKSSPHFSHVLLSKGLTESSFVSNKTAEISYVIPLYLYSEKNGVSTHEPEWINFAPGPFAAIQAAATDKRHDKPNALQVFDYIYGVLHCPGYRYAYAEFLKSDFPRIPLPSGVDEFWRVAEQGCLLRRLHLMEPAALAKVGESPYAFEGNGDSVVTQVRYHDGKVWVNDTQFFNAVPENAWGFYIGGYQPAQKWLKDRKGEVLGWDAINHYQSIITILCETERVMAEIVLDGLDALDEFNGADSVGEE